MSTQYFSKTKKTFVAFLYPSIDFYIQVIIFYKIVPQVFEMCNSFKYMSLKINQFPTSVLNYYVKCYQILLLCNYFIHRVLFEWAN